MPDNDHATKAELAAMESRLNHRIDELRADLRDLRTETHRITFGLAALIVAMGVFT